jgi:hemerythrin
MPDHIHPSSRHGTGNEALDAQHGALLAQCAALADCLGDASEEGERSFRRIFDELMAVAREHYATAEALLADGAEALREEQRNERDEFEYLAAEIITTENFDKQELQRFLALWWTGHVVDCARRHRGATGQQPGP